MNKDLDEQLAQQQELLSAIYKSTEKTRKYFLWTLILSIVFFVVPLVILLFVLPQFISTLTSSVVGF